MNRKHTYNYTYLPPLAFINSVPFPGFSLGWAFRVVVQLFRVVINQLAYFLEKTFDDILADIDQLEKDIENDENFDATAEILIILGKLAFEHEGISEMFESLKEEAHGERWIMKVIFMLCRTIHEKPASDEFTSLKDYNDMFVTIALPAIAATFQEDETFAWMRVAGPNPNVISRLTASMPNFPVTDAMYKAVMGNDDDLNSAIADNRVYVADYALLDGALAGSFPEAQKYMAAPIAMFAVPKAGPEPRKLKPVAIQCQQDYGPNNPIFQPPLTPNDPQAATNWLMAKTVVQTADGNYHEAIAHLGQTHLVVEPFVVATMNNLDDDHPISQLLTPHFEGTLLINNLAQSSLMASGGTVDTVLQGTIDQDRVIAALGTMEVLRDFNNQGPIESLESRGVNDASALPYYPYRDAAHMVFGAIEKWVRGYVNVYYPNESDPANDTALQNWVTELLSHEGGRLANVGEDGQIKTASYLASLLAKVIFIGSAQHASVNFPQKEIMSYTPAMPLAGYSPTPNGCGATEADWFKLLPPKQPTRSQLNIGQLLGGVYYTRLGKYGRHYFKNTQVKALLTQFQAELAKIDNDLTNQFPDYPYLRPSKIPQSINI